MERRKPEHQSAGRHGEAFWQEEKNNFGLKMMQGMGWAQGKGLGKAEAGQKTFLRAVKKENTLGIGAVAGRDEVWNATRDMYNDLLARLAAAAKSGDIAAEAPAEEGDKETSSATAEAMKKYMAKKELYGKFKRAKDASNYDSKSMAEILGRKPTSSPPPLSSPSSSPTRDDASPSPPPGANSLIPTVTATVSIKDYFANKLAGKKLGLTGAGGAQAIADATAGKAASRFQVAGGQGFSEGFQASYYEDMMGRSVMGKGGLGFAGRGEDEEEQKDATVDDFYLKSKKAKQEREQREAEAAAAAAAAASGSDEESDRKARKLAKKEKKRREAAGEAEAPVKLETVTTTTVKVETVTVKVEQLAAPALAAPALAAAGDEEELRKQRKKEKKERRRREAQEAQEAEEKAALEAAAAAEAAVAKEIKKKRKKEKRAAEEPTAAAADEAPKEKKKRKKE